LALESAYSERHRHYHTGDHIEDCLAQLDSVPAIADVPTEVELALWFHDAIYKPTSSKNELKSAEWSQEFLRSAGADDSQGRRVHAYILATRHGEERVRGDAAVVVDIDLSILGREPDVYDVFERAIREEYKWVPWPVYRSKRSELLSSFLRRSRIYATDYFRSRFESSARRNLQRAIEVLSQ
jgi:predicted metal-dependent HD superfamily phosphohydrolase